jgi:dipeptidyl aminopeptidase/acylaminoacyl peptidase
MFSSLWRKMSPMRKQILALCSLGVLLLDTQAQVPENLVADGIPELSPVLKKDVGRYLEFRAATFQGWHPVKREVLISTRFADAAQLHLVSMPGGARRQLTFLPEPVASGSFQPKAGSCLVFSQDVGGGEFYQLFRYDLQEGRISLLTDGKSRNVNPRWSRDGKRLAYSSTRRNGKDTDIYLIDPLQPGTDRMLLQRQGGGWSVLDWSHDGDQLLLLEYISINESLLHILRISTGEVRLLTPRTAERVSYGRALFARGDQSIYATSDAGSEFRLLVQIDISSGGQRPIVPKLKWDVEDLDLSPDGKWLAYVSNENGASALHLLETGNVFREVPVPKLPLGVISGLEWHPSGRELGFSLSSAKSPSDVYSLNVKKQRLERWTQSETGGLNPGTFVEPSLITFKSFDGLSISAFVYRPDPTRFPGRRPAIVSIHGGPESQSRPSFLARNNYLLNELGIALVVPNVRGSSGYGKTFLTLDNGFRREDSVRDIGALLDWIQTDRALDPSHVVVMGGSYGGYMVLACMTHYNDRLKAGVDVVGISNFLTFLQNTQDYRRDLRRVEYGDERDPAMKEFLKKISPTTSVQKIQRPLLVVQGKNDPRVPVTESEQMVQAIRANGGKAWYLMAKDEGHGFAKKRNQDFQFAVTIQFLQEVLGLAPRNGDH